MNVSSVGFEELSKSLVLEAIYFAESNLKTFELSQNELNGVEKQIISYVNKLKEEEKKIKKEIEEKNLDDLAIINSIVITAEKRKKLAYFIKPFRPYLPRFLFREIKMNFMDENVKLLSFMDKLVARFL